MQFQDAEDSKSCELLFADNELLLVSDMVGSSFSGGDDWVVSEQQYQTKFGITVERAAIIRFYQAPMERWTILRSGCSHDRRIEFNNKSTEYMLSRWDDNDFQTITNAQKSTAALSLTELQHSP
jgi:hypothetical protein